LSARASSAAKTTRKNTTISKDLLMSYLHGSIRKAPVENTDSLPQNLQQKNRAALLARYIYITPKASRR
jgi:hypothetical protein